MLLNNKIDNLGFIISETKTNGDNSKNCLKKIQPLSIYDYYDQPNQKFY